MKKNLTSRLFPGLCAAAMGVVLSGAIAPSAFAQEPPHAPAQKLQTKPHKVYYVITTGSWIPVPLERTLAGVATTAAPERVIYLARKNVATQLERVNFGNVFSGRR